MTTLVLLTQRETAEKLRCSSHNVGYMRRSGIIKGIRYGNKWLYRESDIDNFIEHNMGRDFKNLSKLVFKG